MNFFDTILSYLILAYIVVLPIFPSKFKFKGIPLNGDGLLALIILIYLISLIINKKVRERLVKGIKSILQDIVGVFGALLLIVMLVSVTYSLSKGIAVTETVRFATYIALYFIIKLEIREKAIKNTLIGFMIISVVISFIGIMGIPFKFGLESETSSLGGIVRVYSTLENSTNLGAFLILCIFPFLSLAFNEKKRINRLLLTLGTLLIFTALLLSKSRNAFLAFGFGCICYIIMYNWKLIYAFIVAFIGMLFLPQFRDRMLQITDPSQNASRVKLWGIGIKMIKDHPMLGVGNGNYDSYYSKYSPEFKNIEYYPIDGKFRPHDIILKIQSELGILGTFAFIGLMVSIFLKLKKVIKCGEDEFSQNFYKGFIVSFLAFMAMNILDNFFIAPKVIGFFWVLIALSEAIINNSDLKHEIGGSYDVSKYRDK